MNSNYFFNPDSIQWPLLTNTFCGYVNNFAPMPPKFSMTHTVASYVSDEINNRIYFDKVHGNGKIQRITVSNHILVYDAIFSNATDENHFRKVKIIYIADNSSRSAIVTSDEFYSNMLYTLLPGFHKALGCSNKTASELVRFLIFNCQNKHYLNYYEHQGWNIVGTNSLWFASNNCLTDEHMDLVPECIKKRKPLTTTWNYVTFIDKIYMLANNSHWKLKALLGLNIGSLLVFFICNIPNKKIITLIPSENVSEELIVAFLKNQNFENFNTLPAHRSENEIMEELDSTYDGTCLFNNSVAFDDNTKKLNNFYQILISDLRGERNTDASKRHLSAVIMKNIPNSIQNVISDYTVTISFSDVNVSLDPKEVQMTIGFLLSMIISYIINNPIDVFNFLSTGIEIDKQICSENNTAYYLLHLINHAFTFLEKFFNIQIFNDEDKKNIKEYFSQTTAPLVPQCEQVLEEFTAVVSELLRNDTLKLASLDKDKPLDLDDETVFIWQANLEFERRVIEKYVLPRMKTVSKMTTLVSELAAADALLSTDKYTHPISYYDMNGHKKRIYSYSIKSAFFDRDILERVRGFKYDSFYVKEDKKLDSFLPFLINDRKAVAGKNICYNSSDNNHIYITGQSGFGKTFTLCQLAAACYYLKHNVVIFDTSDSFTKDSMKNNLYPEFVDKYVKFINIGDDKIPVNLFRIDTNCNKYKQQTEAFDIINAGIREMSDSAQNAVNSALPLLVDRASNGTLQIDMLPNILDELECNPQTIESLKIKLNTTLNTIKLLGMSEVSWNDYLTSLPRIIVISADSEAFSKGNPLVDMMLMSLYHYQSKNDTTALDIFIDEIQNQRFDAASPIPKIMREGRKKHIAFIGATQDYYSRNTTIGSVMGKADTIISLKPTSNSADLIAKEFRLTNEEKAQFDDMERGDLFIKGNLYSSDNKRNVGCKIFGRLCSYSEYMKMI